MTQRNMTTTLKSKSRRLAYYDADKQKTRTRIFNQLEIEHANSVFEKVEEQIVHRGHRPMELIFSMAVN